MHLLMSHLFVKATHGTVYKPINVNRETQTHRDDEDRTQVCHVKFFKCTRIMETKTNQMYQNMKFSQSSQ